MEGGEVRRQAGCWGRPVPPCARSHQDRSYRVRRESSQAAQPCSFALGSIGGGIPSPHGRAATRHPIHRARFPRHVRHQEDLAGRVRCFVAGHASDEDTDGAGAAVRTRHGRSALVVAAHCGDDGPGRVHCPDADAGLPGLGRQGAGDALEAIERAGLGRARSAATVSVEGKSSCPTLDSAVAAQPRIDSSSVPRSQPPPPAHTAPHGSPQPAPSTARGAAAAT